MSTRAPRWLIAAHIAAVGATLGADLVLLALGIRGQRGSDPVSVYPAMATLVTWILAPSGALSLLTGLVLARRTGRHLLGHGWLTTKLIVTSGLVLLVLLVALPGLHQTADSAQAGTAIPDRSRVTYAVVPALTASLLLLNVVLGVYRPRFRHLATRHRGNET
jgi:hypothetical protein